MNTAKTDDSFYVNVKPLEVFTDVADIQNYVIAPDSWYVVIADMQGSTKAINEGRYKEVNMIGAACINAVLNISAKGEIPYVFGGDGATMLIPQARLDEGTKVLEEVRYLAEQKFNLSLRVGIVSVAEIHERSDHQVLVSKYQVSPNNVLATFFGGGIELAERWIKADTTYHTKVTNNTSPPDLTGLSCRWEPLAAENGVMLSVLVQVKSDSNTQKADIYRELITLLGDVNSATAASAEPTKTSNLTFRWPPKGIKAEIEATVGKRNRIFWTVHVYVNSFLQWCLDKFDISAGGYNGKQYRVELCSNTDYRRFDDTLRILLDCSHQQADEIEAMLDIRSKRGELVYGLHRADSALMTCLVFNLEQGEHIHFVDGSDGGFTSAAKHMKSLM